MVSTVCERIAAAFRNCDNFELETCERRLEEHLRVLAAVSVSRSISSALSSQSRGLFGDLIDGVAILLNSISNYLNCKIQKETKRTTAPISKSTGGRPAYDISKDQLELLRETGMNWKNIATFLGVSEKTIYRRRIDFGLPEITEIYYRNNR